MLSRVADDVIGEWLMVYHYKVRSAAKARVGDIAIARGRWVAQKQYGLVQGPASQRSRTCGHCAGYRGLSVGYILAKKSPDLLRLIVASAHERHEAVGSFRVAPRQTVPARLALLLRRRQPLSRRGCLGRTFCRWCTVHGGFLGTLGSTRCSTFGGRGAFCAFCAFRALAAWPRAVYFGRLRGWVSTSSSTGAGRTACHEVGRRHARHGGKGARDGHDAVGRVYKRWRRVEHPGRHSGHSGRIGRG